MVYVKWMAVIMVVFGIMLMVSSCDLINQNAAEDIDALLAPVKEDKPTVDPTNQEETDIVVDDSTDSTQQIDNEPVEELALTQEEERFMSFYEAIGSVTYNYLEGQVVVINNPDSYYALVNKKNELPEDYVPSDLVIPEIRFSFDGEPDKKYLREVAAIHIALLFDAAELEELYLFGVSGYRSYKTQKTIFDNKVAQRGEEEANKTSARPGQSEHQTGLTMDVSCSSVGYGLETAFGDTPEGLWLADHAHEYGFTIRYLADKVAITGYSYEPWHLRYVGIDLATYLYNNHISLDEFYEWYEPFIGQLNM